MVKTESLEGKTEQEKKGKKDIGQVCGESIETDGQQKKEQVRRGWGLTCHCSSSAQKAWF